MANVVVVGAGIVGLACALESARRGHRVTLVERSPRALGASVRNFGMVWPVGQTPGHLFQRAMRSRTVWIELAERAGFAAERCGSLHVARASDELAVLEEFHDRHGAEFGTRIISAADAVRAAPGLVRDGLLAAMWSPHELSVDPRQAIRAMPTFLRETHGVVTLFGALAIRAEPGSVELSDGREIECDHALVCTGEDFQTLFPHEFESCGLTRCKLQMMRTPAQPGGWRLGPHLAAGLTLLHYKAFQNCKALSALRDRIERERPEYLRWGVHVLASQNEAGEVALGDTHEYGLAVEPFCREDLDRFVLTYLCTFLQLPEPRIAERWMGVYPKSTTGATEFVMSPLPGVWIVNGVGGMGMTLSFGLAHEVWDAVEKGAWEPCS